MYGTKPVMTNKRDHYERRYVKFDKDTNILSRYNASKYCVPKLAVFLDQVSIEVPHDFIQNGLFFVLRITFPFTPSPLNTLWNQFYTVATIFPVIHGTWGAGIRTAEGHGRNNNIENTSGIWFIQDDFMTWK